MPESMLSHHMEMCTECLKGVFKLRLIRPDVIDVRIDLVVTVLFGL